MRSGLRVVVARAGREASQSSQGLSGDHDQDRGSGGNPSDSNIGMLTNPFPELIYHIPVLITTKVMNCQTLVFQAQVMRHASLHNMNSGFRANLKFVRSVFRAGKDEQVAAATSMLKELVRFGGSINEKERIANMRFLKQAMQAACPCCYD